MKKKQKTLLDSDILRIIFIVLGSVFSTVVLTLSILALIKLQEEDYVSSSALLLGVFFALGLSRLITFLHDRTRITFYRFAILLLFDVALGALIFFAKDHPYFYSLVGGLYCVTIIISRLFKLAQKHDLRNIVINAIMIGFAIFLAIGLFMPVKEDSKFTPVLIVCLLVSITAFAEVLSNSLSQLKFKVLFKIVFKTFAFEIILCLLTLIVASSLVLMYVEPVAEGSLGGSFGDSLWYAFAVVTTIGFGDFTAVTPLGRGITVMLGVYGIIVVAVITSIIVNFYNETAGKHDAKELKEITQEEKKK